MPRQPSTDLYFRNAMAPFIRTWWRQKWWRRGPIRQIGASSFIAGDWFVLVRRDTPLLMREALAWSGHLAYVIDDDVSAGITCDSLPASYRARLVAFERGFHRDLLARADTVLVASDALAEALTTPARLASNLARRLAPRLVRIDPVWRQPLADQAHFAALAKGATLRMVQLGTGSHRGALIASAPAIIAALDRHANTSFTYFSARAIHAELENHPRARRLEPMTWPEYQRWMARHRFHLALYPLAQTAFDRARSASKLTEHAILGAAAIYPESWAPARTLGQGVLLAPDDPAAWESAINAAITARDHLQDFAENAKKALSSIQFCIIQQALWRNILGLDPQ